MKNSKSIKVLNEDFKDIYDSILSLSIYQYSNSAFFNNINISPNLTDFEKEIFQQIRKFENHNYLYNSLYISIFATLETYLNNRLSEELEKNNHKCEQLILKYNMHRHYTSKDIINGPKIVAKEILDSIIYHNLPKVNSLFKIVFELDILNILETKRLFQIIKIRHKIVHQSGRINEVKIFVREYAILKDMTLINKWLQNIDSLTTTGKPKNTNTDFFMKFLKTISKYAASPIFEDAMVDLMQNDLNKMDGLLHENNIKKKQILIF